jgi:hypothetical protein
MLNHFDSSSAKGRCWTHYHAELIKARKEGRDHSVARNEVSFSFLQKLI